MKMTILNFRNLVLVFFIGVLLTACRKEDTPEDIIIGTWTAGTTTFTAMVGSKTLVQYFVDIMGLTESEAQIFTAYFNQSIQESFTGKIVIKSDGKYTATLGGTDDSGTWSLSSDGKKLTIDSSTEDPTTFDVIELTSNKLHLNVSETSSEDLNEDGTPETISVSVDVTFTK
jgi:hypothetical protein